MLNNQEIKMLVLIEDLGMQYPTEKSKQKSRYGKYLCLCGKVFRAQTRHIINNETKSCGCLINSKNMIHRLCEHKLYKVWSNMISRIENNKCERYYRYGQRGISICPEWRKDFKSFYDWSINNGWESSLQIDRINNDGNYEPSNCRWATRNTNARNTCIIQSNNTSGYRGVSFHKQLKKWQSQIKYDGKIHYIGIFKTTVEAAMAYDNYVVEHKLEHTINGIFSL